MYLFVDTETTGLPDDFNTLSSYKNLRLVQVAWIIYDNSGRKLSKRDFIVKPEGYEIPDNSTRIHKISTSYAISCGKSLNKVLIELNSAIRSCSYIIAHNLNFDYNILLSEFNRIHLSTTIKNLTKICTMESTTDYCAIVTPRGNKWPSLAELNKKIFHEEIVEAHNAAVDIEATAKCFWYLKKNKLVDFDNITSKKSSIKTITLEDLKGSWSNENELLDLITENKLESNRSNRNNMNLKEYAISLKSYCESIKDGDSVSKRQLERLYQMLDELILLIDETENRSEDWQDIPSSNSGSSSSSLTINDDLPF